MSYTTVLTVAAAVLAVQIISTLAMDAKCKGMDVKMTEEQIMSMKECAKSVGITSMNVSPEQMACLSKCILEKKALVDAEGKPHKENILKLLDVAMPDPVKADIKMHMEKCLDDHGPKVKPGDATCMSYGPLAKCMHEAFTGVCKP